MPSVPRCISALVLRAWVASKSDEVDMLPRPDDAPESHSPGIDSDRILIIGGGPAVGWGVLSHEIALPGSLARALSRRTGRGADVHVDAVPRLMVRSAADELSRIRLDRYDAVVLTVGVNDAGALTPLRRWERDLIRALRVLHRGSRRHARIFVAGVHPIRSIRVYDGPLGSVADAHARRMNAVSRQVCSRMPRADYVELTAPAPTPATGLRDPTSYRHWAEELAERIAPRLDAQRGSDGFDPSVPLDSEEEREAAVRETGLLSDEHVRRFDEAVTLACASFGVAAATVSVIDRDRLVHTARVGEVPERILLRESFSAVVIRERNGMIVPDAHADPRFRRLPHVAGPPRIRFYAGIALESPDGRRIGTLNLFDPEPRASDESWRLPHLRQFGLMVQAQLRRERAARGASLGGVRPSGRSA